jgi:hypothetical protein
MTGPEEKAMQGRSLAGFYIVLGVTAALLGLGAWLWRPVKVRFLETTARTFDGAIGSVQNGDCKLYVDLVDIHFFPSPYGGTYHYGNGDPERANRAIRAAAELAQMGPTAHAAMSRLLKDPDSRVRGLAVVVLGQSRATWASDLVVQASDDETREVAVVAAWAMGRISECRPWARVGPSLGRVSIGQMNVPVESCRQAFVAWCKQKDIAVAPAGSAG